MSKRKRSLSVREDNCAEFPFTISYETSDSPAHQKGHKNKKRKYDGQDENNRAQSQISPFNPKGSFKTYETLLKYMRVEHPMLCEKFAALHHIVATAKDKGGTDNAPDLSKKAIVLLKSTRVDVVCLKLGVCPEEP
ncbi:hypothetical protein RAB80_014425 [Fusarium oxysporum f. sp. vasinfectum]|nr:hypothetical protein RAB80_014425 [Fusarium oxysporum f. sp. vasinfectum]KAK2931676.1 hypothetical protein FoTM2_009192 [Fusarium oxysporum f. sp. vasinfectum]